MSHAATGGLSIAARQFVLDRGASKLGLPSGPLPEFWLNLDPPIRCAPPTPSSKLEQMIEQVHADILSRLRDPLDLRIEYHDMQQSKAAAFDKTHGGTDLVTRWGCAIDLTLATRSGHALTIDRNTAGVGDMRGLFSKLTSLASQLLAASDPITHASAPPSGPTAVVFSPQAAGILLHETIGHGLEESFLPEDVCENDLIGHSIGPNSLEIVDDPTRYDLFGGRRMDDVGQAAHATQLVAGGRIRALIGRNLDANCEAPATINRWRTCYRNPALPRMSNIVVSGGTASSDELLSAMCNGVYVRKASEGLVQRTSRRFRIHVQEANAVSQGRLGDPLLPFFLESRIEDLWSGLIGVGRIGEAAGMYCESYGMPIPVGQVTPALLVERLNIDACLRNAR